MATEYSSGYKISLGLLETWIIQEWDKGISQQEIAQWNSTKPTITQAT